MINSKYQFQVKTILSKHLPANSKIFIFGSSVHENNFHDIDVGVQSPKISEMALIKAKEELEKSTIPYKVDLVDFHKADSKFQKAVLKEKVIWLT